MNNVVKKVFSFIAGFIAGIIAVLYGRKKILDNRDTVKRDRERKDKLDDVSERTGRVQQGIANDVEKLSNVIGEIRKQQVLE